MAKYDYTPVGPMPINIQTGEKDPTSIQLARDMRNKAIAEDVRETMARMIEWTAVLNKFLTKFYENTDRQNSDYYRQFTDAINEFSNLKPRAEMSISRSAEALTNSRNALSVANGIDAKATNAFNLSESADTLSKSVQEQFNQVVIDGDSSVEAAQARVDASGQTNTTLKERLDKEYNEVTTQLSQTNQRLSKMTTIDFDVDCGGIPDGETNNYLAFIKLKERIENLGNENVRVTFTVGGKYAYKPLLPLPENAHWRDLIQLVNAKNIVISGQDTEIIQVGDSAWTADSTPSGLLENESPIQFRNCEKITVEGLILTGARLPYVAVDGTCAGIYARATKQLTIRNVECTGWGTDGITLSRDYGDGDKCDGVLLEHVLLDNNRRQGVSVTGADNVTILHSTFKNTNGGSFGYGLDFETNVGLQHNMKVYNCIFENNERGAMNFIGTTDVVVDSCFINEPTANGAFYFDARNREAKNIKIINSTIKTGRAVVYLGGTKVKDVLFKDNDITTTARANDGATIRLVPAETNNEVDNIQFIRNKFKGIGGILSRITGRFIFKNNEVLMSNVNNIPDYTMRFEVENEGHFIDNTIKIDDTVIFTSKYFFIGSGVFDGNELVSHENAQVRLVDDRYDLQYQVEIGFNKFSQYFYYLGENSNLTVRKPQFIIEKTGYRRKVHGGYARTTQGKNAREGDIIEMFTIEGKLRVYICTLGGTPGTWAMSQVP